LSPYVLSYAAACDTQDGKRFYIDVKDKVMKIDQKYSAFYKERAADEFYVYSNKGYVYAVGRIVDGRLPITVRNRWGLDTAGTCELKN
jgi:hypothetical protein